MTDQLFTQWLMVLIGTVFILAIFRRLQIPVVVAYFTVGLVLQTYLSDKVNFEILRFVGELGIVFLLFSLGLEFSISKLFAMKQMVFGLGTWQVLGSSIVLACLFSLFFSNFTVILLGAIAFSLSSTAIVMKLLNEKNLIHSTSGKTSIAILLFQDLFAMLMLVLIPAFQNSEESGVIAIIWALFKGVLAFWLMLSFGKTIIPRVFHIIASLRSDELFLLTALLMALLTAFITHSLGLSMAMGAFLAGITLGESHYKAQIESDIRGAKDILMGLFFIGIGMSLDISVLFSNTMFILTLLIITLMVKFAIVASSCLIHSNPCKTTIESSLYLAQVGEFGLVILALANNHTLIPKDDYDALITTAMMSMITTPLLIHRAEDIAFSLAKRLKPEQPLEIKPIETLPINNTHHVIICGYGRVGQTLGRCFRDFSIPFVAVDNDAKRVQEAGAGNEPIIYGDASSTDTLKSVGIRHCGLIVITYDNLSSAIKTINNIVSITPNVKIIARTKDESYLKSLQEAGATEVLPERLESTLMIAGRCLKNMKTPTNDIISLFRKIREDNYQFIGGYFHGDLTDISLSAKPARKQLRAITLENDFYATQYPLLHITSLLKNVNIHSIRRQGQILKDLGPDHSLQLGDVVILCGEPSEVERAERLLTTG